MRMTQRLKRQALQNSLRPGKYTEGAFNWRG